MFSTRKGNLFALFFVLHFLAGNFLVAFLMKHFEFLQNILPSIGITQILLVFLPAIYYFLFFKTPVKETFRLYKTRPINIILSILLAFTSIPLVMLINVLSQFIFKPALNDTLALIGQENYLFAILVIAIFPSIFEELISRGIFLSHYKHTKVFTTSLISGLFFGMMHMNMNQFLYAFVLGFLFSIIVHITGSIVTSMIMHFIINSTNLTLAYIATSDFFTSIPGYEEQQQTMALLDQSQLLMQSLTLVLLFVVISLPFFGGILFILISINKKGHLLRGNEPSYKFFPQETIPNNKLLDSLLLDDKIPINNADKPQPIFTLPLILTTTVFIIVAVLTEILS